ncbi:class I SAM-dependent methyltransferase [Cohnella sp.]|uniref:class I SAM-dependent methyltransferase n=1 Tax=Cohnella sp. TaxID=1883426 RepID=UPI0035634C3C
MENNIVLDFGCGTGANCCMSGADHYYGVDPDMQRIQFAKQLYPNHNFKVFDGKRLQIPDRTVDLILIVAVLHHIADDQITEYLSEFRRVLKPEGNMIVIEPYLSQTNKFNNWFMTRYDNGEYIRNEDNYLLLFQNQQYECRVLKKFRKCLLYNELFFTATPRSDFASIKQEEILN